MADEVSHVYAGEYLSSRRVKRAVHLRWQMVQSKKRTQEGFEGTLAVAANSLHPLGVGVCESKE